MAFLIFPVLSIKKIRSDSSDTHIESKAVSYTHLDVYKRQVLRFQKLELKEIRK